MSEAIETPASPTVPATPRHLRVLRNPLTRLLLFFILAGVFGWLLRKLIPLPPLELAKSLAVGGGELWLRALRSLLPTVLAYLVLVLLVERRPATELAPRKFPKHVALGWLIGMTLLLLAACAMALAGSYSVHGLHRDAYLLGPLVVLGILPGITEEIVARGVLFRVVEDGLGTWIALAFSAILFGAGHASNPNATVWSSTAIAIEAGLLLGMAYGWTRSLWFVAGLHAAWNFTQGAILGIPVSGIAVKGLIDSSTQGNVWLSGGEFGAEASILTVVLCISVAAWFTRRALAAGQVRKPVWRRPKVYAILAAAYALLVAVTWFASNGNPKQVAFTLSAALALPLLFALGAAPAPAQGTGPREGEATA